MYTRHFNLKETPQSQPIPGKTMVKNAAGGYAFEVDDWTRLHRFLILGSEGGTYYIGERELTVGNAECIVRCLKEDGERTVREIEGVSRSGAAPKNDPALFALAMASSPAFADERTRKLAFLVMPGVARIGTHLFTYLEYCKAFRGWGDGLKHAVGRWYNLKDPEKLAYQMTKYRQRGGWTHRDVLRLSHPKAATLGHASLFRYATQGEVFTDLDGAVVEGVDLVIAFTNAQNTQDKTELIRLINTYDLTREMIPNQWLKDPEVWEALLDKMPMTAMIRNLANMTRVGLLKPLSNAVGVVNQRLTNQTLLQKARIHPWHLLNALYVYAGRYNHSWFTRDRSFEAVGSVVDALDTAFYMSFGNIEPMNKRIAICIDHSGSMRHNLITSGFRNGEPQCGMTAAAAAAAMALTTARVESNYAVFAFSTIARPIDVSPRERLDDVVDKIERNIGGGTDYSAPIRYCRDNGIKVDAFVVYGDMESWHGNEHACQAIRKYRDKMGVPAKVAEVAMCATRTSLVDYDDAGAMKVVGFDTATPQVISEFIKG